MATPLTRNYLELVEVAKKVETGEYILSDDHRLGKVGGSRVWSIFARIQKKKGERFSNIVFCKTCRNAFNYTKKATTNLFRHQCFQNFIQSNEAVSIVEEGKPTIAELQNGYSPVSNDHLTDLLTKWLIKECQPLDLLQSDGLKAIFNELLALGSKFGDDINVTNLLPNPLEAKKDIFEMYQQCFERVYAEIALIEEHGLGLTSDIWTDSFTKQNYIALAAHYVQSGVLKSCFLGVETFENEVKSNQVILSKLTQILAYFNCKLSRKSILVTDFVQTSSDTSQDVQNLSCLSQLLNNAILKAVEQVPEITEIIKACSNLLSFLVKMEAETLLKGIVNNSYSHPWLKTYQMLNWIKEKWCDIEEVLQSLNEKSMIITININRLQAVVKALQPFEDAIKTLEDDSSPTLHLVIVYLHDLKKSCDTSQSEFNFNFIEAFNEKLRFYLQKIMTEDINTLHKIALFLHPPTNQLLQFNEVEKRIIEDECIRLMQNYKPENTPTKSRNLEAVPLNSAKKRKHLFSDFIASKIDHKSSCDLFSREIQLYKLCDAAYSDDFDVLNWWHLHKDSFPYLYKLSCAVLATPATCTASKRFLMAGNNLLTMKTVPITKDVELQKILFLNANAEQDELES